MQSQATIRDFKRVLKILTFTLSSGSDITAWIKASTQTIDWNDTRNGGGKLSTYRRWGFGERLVAKILT
jgi:hypothetical protein